MAEPIKTPEQAVLIANAYTNLHSVAEPPAAIPFRVDEDVTPFLGERNVGKPAWRVLYPNSYLKFATAKPGFVDGYRRVFTVVLEAASARLFFVSSTYEGKPDPDMRPMPNCGVATEQLSHEEEVYDGYPSLPPRITFLSALESIMHGGIGSPFDAKEIHGAYVLHSRMASKPRPAWAITLRGLPPAPAKGRFGASVPAWQRNHMRNVVDAVSGQVLFATNSPQPL